MWGALARPWSTGGNAEAVKDWRRRGPSEDTAEQALNTSVAMRVLAQKLAPNSQSPFHISASLKKMVYVDVMKMATVKFLAHFFFFLNLTFSAPWRNLGQVCCEMIGVCLFWWIRLISRWGYSLSVLNGSQTLHPNFYPDIHSDFVILECQWTAAWIILFTNKDANTGRENKAVLECVSGLDRIFSPPDFHHALFNWLPLHLF